MENIGSLMATMGIDVSDFNRKIQDIQKSLNTVSKNINSSLNSIEQTSKKTFDSFGKEVQKANKIYAQLEKEIQTVIRAESMLNKGISLLNEGVITSTTFTNRYSKAINLLNSEIKNSYGANLKYEGTINSVAAALNTAKVRESAFSNELKRGAAALKQLVKEQKEQAATAAKAAAAQEKYNQVLAKTQHIQDVSGLQKLRKEQGLLADQTKKTSKAFDSFNGIIKTVRAATIGYATVLATMKVADFASGVITAGVELDSLQRSLEAVTGSTQQANEEFEFIHSVANKYALDIQSVEKSYLGLLASSKKTNLEGEETRRLFSAISGVSAVLGMSVDDTTGTLRALIQMISKGNVQAEELRGQLGERLYGAFRLASEAMGVTTQELNDMLKSGEVLADDLIPKLTRVLENEYADALEKAGDRAGAAFIRLDNAIYELQRSIASSGVLKQFTDLAKETTKWIEANEQLLTQGVKVFFEVLAASGRKALEVIPGIIENINGLVNIYKSLPDDVTGPASYGLIGKMMFGSKAGLFIGTAALINEQMSKLGNGLGDLVDKHTSAGEAITALWESVADAASGRTDWWTGEDLTGSVTISIDTLIERYKELQKVQEDFDPSLGPDFSGYEKQYEKYLNVLAATEEEAQKLINSSTEGKIKKYEEYVKILEQSENKRPELIKAVNAEIMQLEQSLQSEKESLHEAEIEAYNKRLNEQVQEVKKVTEELEYFVDGRRYVLEVTVETNDVADLIKATKEQLDDFEKQLNSTYEYATEQVKKYAEEVIAWEDKIKYARMSTEDKLRELSRKGLSEEKQWNDEKLEADEKLYAAKEALKREDYELAENLAKDAEGIYAGLAEEIKKTDASGSDVVVKSLEDTKKIAMNGVQEVGYFIQGLYGEQKQNAQTSKNEWIATADTIQKKLDEITKQREANIDIRLKNLIDAQNKINALVKDETKYITVITKHVTQNVTESKEGGPILKAANGTFVRRTGQLGGYGGGDKIKALVEAGENITRKESSTYWDSLKSGFMYGINNPLSGVGQSIKEAITGESSTIQMSSGGLSGKLKTPSSNFNTLGTPVLKSAPGDTASQSETLIVRFQVGGVDAPVKITDQSSRTAMKNIAREMSRMKMIYGG